ncbi:hypothetical protein [Cohnella sp. WQ 127256]|uniref:hypothetical protein n=1 Tax=Cohnella sp. WQ 127256 TaxID=2938790 RepID=UPI00211787DA|nr:hypothetical protein [Cohnella sp. WQ 127256]
MEIILKDTDIFDSDISRKIEENMILVDSQLNKEYEYKMTVSFHVELLNDIRVEDVDYKVRGWEKNETRKDKINNLLSFQLDKIDKCLSSCGYNIMNMSIQGDHLETQSIIKVQIIRMASQQSNKRSKSPKVMSIVPSLSYTQDLVSKLASKELSEIFSKIMNAIPDKKIWSEALEIEQTDNVNVLWQAFVNQYSELWLTTSENEKALINKLKGKFESAIMQSVKLKRKSNI